MDKPGHFRLWRVSVSFLLISSAAASPAFAGGNTPTGNTSKAATKTKAFVPAASSTLKASALKPVLKPFDLSPDKGDLLDLGGGKVLIYGRNMKIGYSVPPKKATIRIVDSNTAQYKTLTLSTNEFIETGKISENKQYAAFLLWNQGKPVVDIVDLKNEKLLKSVKITFKAQANQETVIKDIAIGNDGTLRILGEEAKEIPPAEDSNPDQEQQPVLREIIKSFIRSYSKEGTSLPEVTYNLKGKEGVYTGIEIRGSLLYTYGTYSNKPFFQPPNQLMIRRFELPSGSGKNLRLLDYKKFPDTHVNPWEIQFSQEGSMIASTNRDQKQMILLTLGKTSREDKVAVKTTSEQVFFAMSTAKHLSTYDASKNLSLNFVTNYPSSFTWLDPLLLATDLKSGELRSLNLQPLLTSFGLKGPKYTVWGFALDPATRNFTMSVTDYGNGEKRQSYLITGNLDRDLLSPMQL